MPTVLLWEPVYGELFLMKDGVRLNTNGGGKNGRIA